MNAPKRAARGTMQVERARALPPVLKIEKSTYSGGKKPTTLDEFGRVAGSLKSWGSTQK